MMIRTKHVPALVALLALACHSGGSDAGDDGSVDPNALTYYEDVAPILVERCNRCHREGGAGPFRLESYEDVEPIGEWVRDVTQARIMPPWLADDSGDCNHFKDSAWLSEQELETIAQWVDDGKLEGDPANMPEIIDADDSIESPSVLLEFEQAYAPNTVEDNDDYHCFLIDPELDQDMFLTAYEVIPGDPKIVHHVVIYSPLTDLGAQEVLEADAKDPGEGYSCFGGPGTDDAILVAAWAPGRATWKYPEGSGVPIKAGMPQIVQLHYNVNEGQPTDRSAVAYALTEQVDQQILPWFFANTELALPPGQKSAFSNFEITPDLYMDQYDHPEWAEAMQLVGVGPHMHQMGKSLRLEVTKADASETSCLVDVPRWDFNWQFWYEFEQPVDVSVDDLLRLQCTYDTTTESETTFWGDGTDEEMCLTVMFSTFDDGVIPGM